MGILEIANVEGFVVVGLRMTTVENLKMMKIGKMAVEVVVAQFDYDVDVETVIRNYHDSACSKIVLRKVKLEQAPTKNTTPIERDVGDIDLVQNEMIDWQT